MPKYRTVTKKEMSSYGFHLGIESFCGDSSKNVYQHPELNIIFYGLPTTKDLKAAIRPHLPLLKALSENDRLRKYHQSEFDKIIGLMNLHLELEDEVKKLLDLPTDTPLSKVQKTLKNIKRLTSSAQTKLMKQKNKR